MGLRTTWSKDQACLQCQPGIHFEQCTYTSLIGRRISLCAALFKNIYTYNLYNVIYYSHSIIIHVINNGSVTLSKLIHTQH